MRRAGVALALGAALGACEGAPVAGAGADGGPEADATPGVDTTPSDDAGVVPPGADAPRRWHIERRFDAADGLRGPDGLAALDGARLLVANEVGGNVLEVDLDQGTVAVRVERGAGGLRTPEEVAVGPDGALWFTDDAAVAVFRVAASGGAPEAVLGGDDGLLSPEGVAVGPDGTLYVSDEKAHIVLALAPGATAPVTLATEADGVFAPEALALAADGTLYVADDRRGGVLAIGPDGRPSRFLDAETLALPEAVAVDAAGDLWFTDNGGAATVQRFSPAGERLEVVEMPVDAGTLAGIAALPDGRLAVSVSRRATAEREGADELWVLTPERNP